MSLLNKRGKDNVHQAEHALTANAKKTMSSVLVPGAVLGPDATAGLEVGANNICRIRTTGTTYVTFGPDTTGTPSSASSPAIELFGAGVFLVTATNNFIKSDIAFARLEVIPG